MHNGAHTQRILYAIAALLCLVQSLNGGTLQVGWLGLTIFCAACAL